MNEKVLPDPRNLRILRIKTEYGSLAFIFIINLLNIYFLLQATTGKSIGINLGLFILFIFVFNLVYISEGGIFLFEAVCYDRNRNVIYILHQGCYPKKKLNVRFYGMNWYLSVAYTSDQLRIKRGQKKTRFYWGTGYFYPDATISRARDKLIFGDEVESD